MTNLWSLSTERFTHNLAQKALFNVPSYSDGVKPGLAGGGWALTAFRLCVVWAPEATPTIQLPRLSVRARQPVGGR